MCVFLILPLMKKKYMTMLVGLVMGVVYMPPKPLFENVWIYTFGVGALCATRVCHFSEEMLGQMLSTEFQAMMLFVRSKNGAAR